MIITSLLISFYVGKTIALDYETELRNHSLSRLYSNISDDVEDSKINLSIYTNKKCEYLFNNYDSLLIHDIDRIAGCFKDGS